MTILAFVVLIALFYNSIFSTVGMLSDGIVGVD
jgi:hypothetical protein